MKWLHLQLEVPKKQKYEFKHPPPLLQWSPQIFIWIWVLTKTVHFFVDSGALFLVNWSFQLWFSHLKCCYKLTCFMGTQNCNVSQSAFWTFAAKQLLRYSCKDESFQNSPIFPRNPPCLPPYSPKGDFYLLSFVANWIYVKNWDDKPTLICSRQAGRDISFSISLILSTIKVLNIPLYNVGASRPLSFPGAWNVLSDASCGWVPAPTYFQTHPFCHILRKPSPFHFLSNFLLVTIYWLRDVAIQMTTRRDRGTRVKLGVGP